MTDPNTLVWVASDRPLQWFHKIVPAGDGGTPRTGCKMSAHLYGSLVTVDAARRNSHQPCPECWRPVTYAPPVPRQSPSPWQLGQRARRARERAARGESR